MINNHSFRGSICIDDLSASGFVSDYNLLVNRLSNDDGNSNMSLQSWQALGYDMHSQIVMSENQLFINHNSGDFHLLPSSQPLDIGTSLVSSVVAVDADGISRPQGSGYDIGAYEYSSTTSVKDKKVVNDFKLYQNYPNPFNPSTKIKYCIPFVKTHRDASLQNVTLKVFDILGNEITTLVNEEKSAGTYEIEFQSSVGSLQLASGIYFYRLQSGKYVDMKKMLLLK